MKLEGGYFEYSANVYKALFIALPYKIYIYALFPIIDTICLVILCHYVDTSFKHGAGKAKKLKST